jgi:trehalose 6-phosphate synthase/phosphatase
LNTKTVSRSLHCQVRDELLRGLLSASLLGFHLFDYARHFLSACTRLLNLEHESRRGSLGVEYGGRHVMIRVSHIGIDPKRFQEYQKKPEVVSKTEELKQKFKDKIVLGAIDDLDIVKGISLKLMALDFLLANYSSYRNRIVLNQVAIPKAARVKENVRNEIRSLVNQINERYGNQNYQPVMYFEREISFDERVAMYRQQG